MKTYRAIVLSLGSCALAATMFAPAYMKLGDIKGEATAAKDGHKNEIEILSFSFGASQAGAARDVATGQPSGKRDAATGQASGKRQHAPITIVKQYDKSSPMLAKAMASGEVIKEIEVSDGAMLYKLRDCIITSIQASPNSSGGDRPTESISLNYDKIEATPVKAKADDAALRESPTRASTGKTATPERAP